MSALTHDDHFYGWSKFTKNCLPYSDKRPDLVWTWMDDDCMFQNNQTGEVHLIEIKCQQAQIKAYQQRILNKLREMGVKIHHLRLEYEPWYNGDHEILTDPRFATRIELDNRIITLDELKFKLLEWHGIDAKDYEGSLHREAVLKASSLRVDTRETKRAEVSN